MWSPCGACVSPLVMSGPVRLGRAEFEAWCRQRRHVRCSTGLREGFAEGPQSATPLHVFDDEERAAALGPPGRDRDISPHMKRFRHVWWPADRPYRRTATPISAQRRRSGQSAVVRRAEKGITDKATLVKKLKQSTDACTAAYGGKGKPGELLRNISHSNLHYGNVITYMRMLGLVPPSS